ncbi:MAG: WD40 repeat domain-containing protein [Candidatus Brocadiia bacterium]
MKTNSYARSVLAFAVICTMSVLVAGAEDVGTTLESALKAFQKAAASGSEKNWADAAQTANAAMTSVRAGGDYRAECAAAQLAVSAAAETDFDIEKQTEAARKMTSLAITEHHDWYIRGVDCSPNGKLAVLTLSYSVEIWDIAGRKTARALPRMPETVNFAFFTADGKSIVMDGGRVVKILDVETGKWVGTLRGAENEIGAGQISPDRRILFVSERWGSNVCAFDMKEQKILWRKPSFCDYGLLPVSESGSRILLYKERGIILADCETGRTIAEASYTPPAEDFFLVGEDGALLCGGKENVVLWRSSDGTLTKLKTPLGYVSCTQALPEFGLFALSTYNTDFNDCRVVFFDAATAEQKSSFRLAEAERVYRFVRQGKLLVALCEGAPSFVLAADGSGVKGMLPIANSLDAAILPDGFLLATGFKKLAMAYLPAFEKVGVLTQLAGEAGSLDCAAVATTVRKALAEYTAGKDQAVLSKARRYAKTYASTALVDGSPFDMASAWSLLESVFSASGVADGWNDAAHKAGLPFLKAEGGKVLGVGFGGGRSSLTWATGLGYYRMGIGDEWRTEHVKENWGKATKTFIGPWSGTVVTATNPGCYVIYRSCHNGEFPFLEEDNLLDVVFSSRGVEAALVLEDSIVVTEFWMARNCARFDVTGLKPRQIKISHGDSLVMPRKREIGFHEYSDSNTGVKHDNIAPYFTIPDALPGDISALDVDSEDKLLCACDGNGNIGVWNVDFDVWRGKMPNWSKDRIPYDPAKGRIPIKSFQSGIAHADFINYVEGKEHMILVGSQETGEFAAFSSEGMKLGAAKGTPGRGIVSGDGRTVALNSLRSVSVLRPAEGLAATFEFSEEISSIALSPDGAFLLAGGEKGNLYLRFVEGYLKN